MNREQAIKYLVEKYEVWPNTLPLREPDHVTWGWSRVGGEIKFFNKSESLEFNISEGHWQHAKNRQGLAPETPTPARDPKFWSREKTLEAMTKHLNAWPNVGEPAMEGVIDKNVLLHDIGWAWRSAPDTSVLVLIDRSGQLESIERDDWLVANDPLRDWAKPLSPEEPVVMTRDEALHYLKTNIGNWPRPSDHTHATINGWEWSSTINKDYMVFIRSSKKTRDMSDEDVIKFSDWAPVRPTTKKPLVMGREQALEYLRAKYDTWPTRAEMTNEVVDGWLWSSFVGESLLSFIRNTAPHLALDDNDIIRIHHWQTPAEGNIKIYSGAVGDEDRKLLAESVVATPTMEDLARLASIDETDPIMKYFEWSHLPAKLQAVSEPLCEMAKTLDELLPEGPEKAAGMRKLLEAKDCLVRAIL